MAETPTENRSSPLLSHQSDSKIKPVSKDGKRRLRQRAFCFEKKYVNL